MHKAILLIGGNQGNTLQYIAQAKELIQQHIGNIITESGFYESEPWGFDDHQNFINQVIEIECISDPMRLLKQGKEIETILGRKAKTKSGYEGRPMDIDILFYDQLIYNEPLLIIPHPKLHERKFTLLPLLEKWENHIHPFMNKTVRQLMEECKDSGWVNKMPS